MIFRRQPTLIKLFFLVVLALCFSSQTYALQEILSEPKHETNYHLVGWFNTFIPGGGQFLLGDPLLGSAQAGLEVGTFYWGYSMSKRSPMTLDGVPEELPGLLSSKRNQFVDINEPLYANILQEFGLKYHMVNVFDAYRESAKRNGVTEGIDQSSDWELFKAPLQAENLTNPWVWVPLSAIAVGVLGDYFLTRGSVDRQQPLTPYSNYLFAFHYGFWEPMGSGAPEEMFYRGFLQNEFQSWTGSPYLSIPMSTALFALSHEPGGGRIGATVAGLYLGFLASQNNGNLKPGITLHFWGSVLLGLETILLNHEGQHSTPPSAMGVQINY